MVCQLRLNIQTAKLQQSTSFIRNGTMWCKIQRVFADCIRAKHSGALGRIGMTGHAVDTWDGYLSSFPWYLMEEEH